MKKLMIAAAIVCVAAVSQAAKANWTTGDCYYNGVGSKLSDDESGTYNYSGDAYLFLLTADQYSSITQGDAASLWNKFTANGSSSTLDFGETLGKATFKGTKALDEGAASFSGSSVGDFEPGNVYAAWIITHEDVEGKVDAYSANAFYAESSPTALTGSSNSALGWGKKHSGTETTWQSVPEPTSGLLLLLGVAGLALRRRRA